MAPNGQGFLLDNYIPAARGEEGESRLMPDRLAREYN